MKGALKRLATLTMALIMCGVLGLTALAVDVVEKPSDPPHGSVIVGNIRVSSLSVDAVFEAIGIAGKQGWDTEVYYYFGANPAANQGYYEMSKSWTAPNGGSSAAHFKGTLSTCSDIWDNVQYTMDSSTKVITPYGDNVQIDELSPPTGTVTPAIVYAAATGEKEITVILNTVKSDLTKDSFAVSSHTVSDAVHTANGTTNSTYKLTLSESLTGTQVAVSSEGLGSFNVTYTVSGGGTTVPTQIGVTATASENSTYTQRELLWEIGSITSDATLTFTGWTIDKVIGTPPENVTATAGAGVITVTQDADAFAFVVRVKNGDGVTALIEVVKGDFKTAPAALGEKLIADSNDVSFLTAGADDKWTQADWAWETQTISGANWMVFKYKVTTPITLTGFKVTKDGGGSPVDVYTGTPNAQTADKTAGNWLVGIEAADVEGGDTKLFAAGTYTITITYTMGGEEETLTSGDIVVSGAEDVPTDAKIVADALDAIEKLTVAPVAEADEGKLASYSFDNDKTNGKLHIYYVGNTAPAVELADGWVAGDSKTDGNITKTTYTFTSGTESETYDVWLVPVAQYNVVFTTGASGTINITDGTDAGKDASANKSIIGMIGGTSVISVKSGDIEVTVEPTVNITGFTATSQVYTVTVSKAMTDAEKADAALTAMQGLTTADSLVSEADLAKLASYPFDNDTDNNKLHLYYVGDNKPSTVTMPTGWEKGSTTTESNIEKTTYTYTVGSSSATYQVWLWKVAQFNVVFEGGATGTVSIKYNDGREVIDNITNTSSSKSAITTLGEVEITVGSGLKVVVTDASNQTVELSSGKLTGATSQVYTIVVSKKVTELGTATSTVAPLTHSVIDAMTGAPAVTDYNDLTYTVDNVAHKISVAGTLKYTTGFTGFSELTPDGYFAAFQIEVPAAVGASAIAISDKPVFWLKTNTDADAEGFKARTGAQAIELRDGKYYIDCIYIITDKASANFVVGFDWDGGGTTYERQDYTIDFSKITLDEATKAQALLLAAAKTAQTAKDDDATAGIKSNVLDSFKDITSVITALEDELFAAALGEESYKEDLLDVYRSIILASSADTWEKLEADLKATQVDITPKAEFNGLLTPVKGASADYTKNKVTVSLDLKDFANTSTYENTAKSAYGTTVLFGGFDPTDNGSAEPSWAAYIKAASDSYSYISTNSGLTYTEETYTYAVNKMYATVGKYTENTLTPIDSAGSTVTQYGITLYFDAQGVITNYALVEIIINVIDTTNTTTD